MLFKRFLIILSLVFTLYYLFVAENDIGYNSLYFITLFILITNFIINKDINNRIFSVFFVLYYGLTIPNIGFFPNDISYKTNFIFSLSIILSLISLNFFTISASSLSNIREVLLLNRKFEHIFNLHIFLAYSVLIYIVLTKGLIIIYQDERFFTDVYLKYILKSTIYIPLIYLVTKNSVINKKSFIKYIILPLFPSLFIGSRASIILIVLAIFVLLFFRRTLPFNIGYKLYNYNITLKKVFLISFLITLIIVSFFYIRRSTSDIYVSGTEIVEKYTGRSDYFTLISAPIYFVLKRQINTTDAIIKNEFENIYTDYPLFFADLLTVLPGSQVSSGKSLNYLISGETHGGLTPSLIGGLYLDFGFSAILGMPLIFLLIANLYYRSFYSDISLVFYSITFVQVFHLFHRGFLKPEYIIAYLIIYIYIKTLTKEKIQV